MGGERWRQAWRSGRTAFHRPAVHEELVAHHDAVLGGAGRVLVPLSGRSVDLPWLADRGHEVVGIEIVEEVVVADFADRGEPVAPTPLGPFHAYRAGRLTVLAGDVMDADPRDLGTFDGAWDRAALVALPPPERPPYVAVLRRLLRPGARVLLQTFGCDRPADVGPPYRVGDAEVRALYPDAEVRVVGGSPAGPEGWPAVTYDIRLPAAPASE